MTNCSELIIFRVVDRQRQSTTSVLILKELEGDRRLPVLIGKNEVKAILLAMEDVKAMRPLTHDLFVSFMYAVRYSLKHVLVYRFFESIYYTRLCFLDEKGNEFFIESRLSDAVAIALRCKAPIYANEEVLDKAGISASQMKNEDMEYDLPNEDIKEKTDFFDYNDDELAEMLQETVENEEFEKSSLIRDEINRRKKM